MCKSMICFADRRFFPCAKPSPRIKQPRNLQFAVDLKVPENPLFLGHAPVRSNDLVERVKIIFVYFFLLIKNFPENIYICHGIHYYTPKHNYIFFVLVSYA